MSSDYDNDLLNEGILNFKAGEFDKARDYLERALEVADDDDTRARANFYLSRLTDDPARKRTYLEETLAIDMTNAEARRDLALLDGRLKPDEIVDPEAQLPTAPGTVTVKADHFTCPKCGGRMTYAPDGCSLVCEYCQRTEPLKAEPPGKEEDFFVAMADGLGQRKPVSMVTFQCQGCGARFFLAPQEISAICAYCGSAQVVATQDRRELLEPDAILPMAFDQKRATRHLVDWVEGHKIQPQGKVLEPRGLYLPVWIFDIIGNVPWRGYRYTRSGLDVVSILSGSGQQKGPASGEYPVQFDNVCVAGMHKLADLLVKTLPGFDFLTVPAYDPRFLSGWPAEIYEVSMADASLDARRISVERVCQGIKTDLDGVHDLTCSPSTIAVTAFKLVLVPVWLTDYTYEGRSCRVLINGQTGETVGETPSHGILGRINPAIGK